MSDTSSTSSNSSSSASSDSNNFTPMTPPSTNRPQLSSKDLDRSKDDSKNIFNDSTSINSNLSDLDLNSQQNKLFNTVSPGPARKNNNNNTTVSPTENVSRESTASPDSTSSSSSVSQSSLNRNAKPNLPNTKNLLPSQNSSESIQITTQINSESSISGSGVSGNLNSTLPTTLKSGKHLVSILKTRDGLTSGNSFNHSNTSSISSNQTSFRNSKLSSNSIHSSSIHSNSIHSHHTINQKRKHNVSFYKSRQNSTASYNQSPSQNSQNPRSSTNNQNNDNKSNLTSNSDQSNKSSVSISGRSSPVKNLEDSPVMESHELAYGGSIPTCLYSQEDKSNLIDSYLDACKIQLSEPIPSVYEQIEKLEILLELERYLFRSCRVLLVLLINGPRLTVCVILAHFKTYPSVK